MLERPRIAKAPQGRHRYGHRAAALLWAREAPSGKELVSLDARLREAALLEGFRVVPDAA
ncbi:MAG: hypothetical protein ACOYOH_28990 [Paracraurococcus sp.]